MLDKPNVFNIPANYNFFESLFDWMRKKFSDQLAEVKIFLPNRRSCRELQEIFLQKNFCGALPKIKAISDISIDDFFDFLPDIETKQIIDEILRIKLLDGIDYLLFLSREVQNLSMFGQNLELNQAIKIASNLQNLFDEVEREEIDLQKLGEIDDSDLSQHRQLTLDFLKNFNVQIKNSLLKKNIFFPAAYQNFIIQKFIYLLEKHGSKTPIIIAGSTGSISFSKKLIKTISCQTNGHVILYGLNEGNFEQENHPQFFLNQLIHFLEIEKESVKKIVNSEFCLSDDIRQEALSLLTLPSEEISKWQKVEMMFDVKKASEDLSKNIQIIEAKNEIEESKLIAIILAENFQQQKTAALITNNHKLATLVKYELRRLSILFNDSRNIGIFDSKLINFLLLILDVIESNFNSHSLLALLKNPLCFFSLDKKTLAEFEIKILRQDRINLDLSGTREKLKSLNEKKLDDFFEEFLSKIDLHSLIKSAENLSQKSWQELLDSDHAQIELSDFFEKLESQNLLKNSENFLATFKTLLAQISYFQKSDSTAPIQILSTLEARLLNHDLVIIGSLNEGDFPAIETENWLGKKIKKDLEIDRGAKKFGQSAYDFCNYLSNKSVILTRCKSRDNMLLIESPFLLKFKTLCKKIGVKINHGEKYFSLLKKMSSVEVKEVKSQNPKPKIELRPKKFSITEISKLIANPYEIYAKKILQLRELKKIDFEPSYSEFGSFVHEALEGFVKDSETKSFSKIFEKYFPSEEAKLIWWPKFENIFSNFIKENEQFSNCRNYLEVPVKLSLGKFLINGKIDRIIFDKEENVEIFDYKTGQIPATKNVICGIEPQLTIAALALLEGMIDIQLTAINSTKITSLNYWKLSSSSTSEIRKICKKNEEIKILTAAAKSGLTKLLEFFEDEKNGYTTTENSQKEYSHLTRTEY
jgi:ATP-dependent helicase/nuclease subunit B